MDAGLEDDEIIPGQYDVAFDLSSADIGSDLYDFLKVYRIGDNGDYYELNVAADDGILQFSCNQNSARLIGGSIILAVTALSAVGKEYYDRNVYFIGKGYKAGEEIAILFHGALSSTLWICEWVEQ